MKDLRARAGAAYDRGMRAASVAACLAVLGALQLAPGPPSAGPERWRLSLAPAAPGAGVPVVEVLVDDDGVLAYRAGARGAAGVTAWEAPAGDAVALDGTWWALAGVEPVAASRPGGAALAALGVEVVDAATGDPDGDGTAEVVVVFRRPFRQTVVSGLLPEAVHLDGAGRSLHLGIYTTDLQQEWVAGTVFRQVTAVAACDGALALRFGADEGALVGASLWGGFGFTSLPGLPDLPGGEPGCADVDGDGRTEPVVSKRTSQERTPS